MQLEHLAQGRADKDKAARCWGQFLEAADREDTAARCWDQFLEADIPVDTYAAGKADSRDNSPAADTDSIPVVDMRDKASSPEAAADSPGNLAAAVDSRAVAD